MTPHRSPRRIERGSIIVNVAISLSLIVILLIGSELGYLFYLKRELQKTADLAALAGVTSLTNGSCSAARTGAKSNANTGTIGNMPPGLALLTDDEVTCGTWTSAGTGTTAASRFTAATTNLNAVQIAFSRTPDSLLAFFTGNRTINVHAVAAQALPRAALSIRTTLAAINTSQSAVLNAIFNGILGGNLNLTAVGWQGLIDSNVNILSYLDAILGNKTGANLTIGQYEDLLNTELSIGELTRVMLTAISSQLSASQQSAINLQAAVLGSSALKIKLRDLFGILPNTPAAALDLNVQAFQMLQAMVQIATGTNAAVVTVPLGNLLGIANVNAQIKIIENTQFSSVGNPALVDASLGTLDPNKIYVRTSQIRSLVTVQIPLLNSIAGLANAATGLLGDLVSMLNGLLGGLLGAAQRIVLISDPNIEISINLNLAPGEALVSGYSCPPQNKSLSVKGKSSIASLNIGQLTATQKQQIFSSTQPLPSVGMIPIYDVQTNSTLLGLGPWKTVSRTGLSAQIPIASSAWIDLPLFDSPPELNSSSKSWQTISSKNIVSSLEQTLSGLSLTTINYDGSSSTGLLSAVNNLLVNLTNSAISSVKTVVASLLAPLLDTMVNLILNSLGLTLGSTEIGANLSCSKGAELVY